MNLFDVFGRECARCGSTELVFIHYKHGPPSKDPLENFEVLCQKCHKKEKP